MFKKKIGLAICFIFIGCGSFKRVGIDFRSDLLSDNPKFISLEYKLGDEIFDFSDEEIEIVSMISKPVDCRRKIKGAYKFRLCLFYLGVKKYVPDVQIDTSSPRKKKIIFISKQTQKNKWELFVSFMSFISFSIIPDSFEEPLVVKIEKYENNKQIDGSTIEGKITKSYFIGNLFSNDISSEEDLWSNF